MNKKVLVLLVCMLLVSFLATGAASADACKRKPNTTQIIQNSPPDAPEVTVPNEVRRASWLNIETVSTDPENDNVYYKYDIDGHDYGWVGPFKSGEKHIEKVKLIVPTGSYTLGVKAKDTHDAESEWTYTNINVVRTKSAPIPLIRLLQNRISLFTLLHFFIN